MLRIYLYPCPPPLACNNNKYGTAQLHTAGLMSSRAAVGARHAGLVCSAKPTAWTHRAKTCVTALKEHAMWQGLQAGL